MKIELILQGEVVKTKDGKRIVFEKPDFYRQQVNQFPEKKKIEVVIREKKEKRSKKQNSYWWAVCFPIIAELYGCTINDAHDLCVERYITPKILKNKVTGEEEEVSRGTSELSKQEGVIFTRDIKLFASEELQGYIPTPCESGYNCNRPDCEICFISD